MQGAELYARVKKEGGFADLSARAKFRLTGADRVRYLNGQVTTDVTKLQQGESRYACITTAKGKLCGDVFITTGPDFFLVDADPSLRESLAARLERYIIADDVHLKDVTEELGLLHLRDEAKVGRMFALEVPLRANADRLGAQGEDFVVRREQMAALKAELSSVPELNEEMQELFRIEAGRPRWGSELTEDTLPPEAGLDRTAIDYHKGCYVGQEVISRIRSVGHVNKTLCGFVSESAPLAPGMQLFAEDKPAGWLTSAAHSFGLDRPVALGYLKRGIDAPVLTARSSDGKTICAVEVKALPLCA